MDNIKEILIINQPIGNRGDESAHRALVRSLNLSMPSAHITVITFIDWTNGIKDFIVHSPHNEYVRFLFPHNLCAMPCALFFIKHGLTKVGTYAHPILHRLLKYYRRADLVLCAPGGICMGGFQNWRHMYLLQLARDLNKPIVYYSRSIGPFPTATPLNRKFKKLSMEMLHDFRFLSLRDKESKRIADHLGVNYISSIDTAFLEQPRCEIPIEIAQVLQDKFVVVVPNQLTWHFAYSHVVPSLIDEFYVNIIRQLQEVYPAHQIVMLPQLCSNPHGIGDYHYFLHLKEMMEDDHLLVVPDTYSSDIQQSIISRSAFVVGARYHSIVFAINNEVPFIGLSYEHKIQGLLEDLDLSEHIVDITRAFDNPESVAQAATVFSNVLTQVKKQHPQREKAHLIAINCFQRLIHDITRPET